jgi:hypothetical protein
MISYVRQPKDYILFEWALKDLSILPVSILFRTISLVDVDNSDSPYIATAKTFDTSFCTK